LGLKVSAQFELLLVEIFESTADRVFYVFIFVFLFRGTGRLHTVHFCTLECSSSILVFAKCYLHFLFPFSNKSYGPNIVTPGRQHLRCAYNLLFSLQYHRPSKYSTDFSWKCQQIDFPDLQRQVRKICICIIILHVIMVPFCRDLFSIINR
jgi:hypothetical protein